MSSAKNLCTNLEHVIKSYSLEFAVHLFLLFGSLSAPAPPTPVDEQNTKPKKFRTNMNKTDDVFCIKMGFHTSCKNERLKRYIQDIVVPELQRWDLHESRIATIMIIWRVSNLSDQFSKEFLRITRAAK